MLAIFAVKIELPQSRLKKVSDFINIQEILIVSTTSFVCANREASYLTNKKITIINHV